MLETLIPADLSDICNARVAASRIEQLVNVALREEVFNYGNLMTPAPIGGMPKVSVAIGLAVPTATGLQVRITAEATFVYYPEMKEASLWPTMTSIQETEDTVPLAILRPTEVKV